MWEVIFSKILDFIVTDFWGNIVFWRTTAILLFALVIFVLKFRRSILAFLNRDQEKSRDRDIFNRSDQIMNERQLLDFLEVLGTNRYLIKQARSAQEYVVFFEEEGNKYIGKNLGKACTKLIDKLDVLNIFAAQHFFVYPERQEVDDNCQMALYPEILHGSPSTEGYDHAKKCEQELHSMLDIVKTKYRNYRQAVRKHLNE